MKKTAVLRRDVGRARPALFAATEFLETRRLLSFSDLKFVGDVVVDPATAHPGDAIHVNFTVTNGGERNAEHSTTRVQILRGTTVVLQTSVAEGGLATGASRTESDTFALPTDLATGTYTAVVQLDSTTSAAQGTNTTNDNAHRSFTVTSAETHKPNLIAGHVVAASATAHPGDPIVLHWQISNAGTGDAAATTTDVRLGASESVIPGADATLLSKPTAAISANAVLNQDGTATIPAGTAPGTYFLWVVADASVPPVLTETTTNDNTAHSTGIVITVAEVRKPNLLPASVTPAKLAAHPGDTLALTWQMYNTGGGDAAATMTDVRLGTNDSAAPGAAATLLSKSTPAIPAQFSTNQDGTVTVPANTAPGTYFLWVIADASVPPVLSETTTSDNAAHSHAIVITVAAATKPNLVPSNVHVNATTAAAGSTVGVTWTMSNLGTAVAAATSTTIRLGTSETVFPDKLLANVDTASIPAGGALSQSATVTIPLTTAPGRHFIWIGADLAGVLVQTSTTDDHAHSAGFNVTSPTTAVPLHLAFDHAIHDGTAGKLLSPIVVLVEDPDGHVVTTAQPKITLATATGPDGGKLMGTTTVMAKNGRAVFSNVYLRATGTYTLAGAATGETGATSNSFVIAAAAASRAAFAAAPSDGLPANSQSITVQLFDKFGNLATSAAGSISLLLASKPNGDTVTGDTSVDVVNGQATFSAVSFSSAGKYSLAATIAGMKKLTSRRFTIS